MNKIYYILSTVIFFSACAVLNKTSLSEEVLFTIDEDHILADEFIYVYEKNNFNNDSLYTSKDVDEYFDLFINFKLKVAAAKGEGMDTTETFQSEFKTESMFTWFVLRHFYFNTSFFLVKNNFFF